MSSPRVPSTRTAATPPFFRSMRPPVKSNTVWEKSGSCPTTSTRASSPWAASRARASLASNPADRGWWTIGSAFSAFAARRAVSRARTRGLV